VRSPHRFALMGLTALALLVAGCSPSSSPSSSSGTSWSTATTASAGKGLSKLVAAARKEVTSHAPC
jgi:ABC-type glycerol-3-phosphate transport system substrate-binding protein